MLGPQLSQRIAFYQAEVKFRHADGLPAIEFGDFRIVWNVGPTYTNLRRTPI
jgi:hypothetical protein